MKWIFNPAVRVAVYGRGDVDVSWLSSVLVELVIWK